MRRSSGDSVRIFSNAVNAARRVAQLPARIGWDGRAGCAVPEVNPQRGRAHEHRRAGLGDLTKCAENAWRTGKATHDLDRRQRFLPGDVAEPDVVERDLDGLHGRPTAFVGAHAVDAQRLPERIVGQRWRETAHPDRGSETPPPQSRSATASAPGRFGRGRCRGCWCPRRGWRRCEGSRVRRHHRAAPGCRRRRWQRPEGRSAGRRNRHRKRGGGVELDVETAQNGAQQKAAGVEDDAEQLLIRLLGEFNDQVVPVVCSPSIAHPAPWPAGEPDVHGGGHHLAVRQPEGPRPMQVGASPVNDAALSRCLMIGGTSIRNPVNVAKGSAANRRAASGFARAARILRSDLANSSNSARSRGRVDRSPG